MNIAISKGNTKLGKIPNFNLPPVVTCSKAACQTCAKEGCYALKAYRMYEQTRAAYDRNFEACQKDLANVEKQLMDYFFKNHTKITRFRIHSSGDFYSKNYFNMWLRIAASFPLVSFMAYTKQFENVHDKCLPTNFNLYISVWHDLKTEVPERLWLLPTATLIHSKEDTHGFICPGSCVSCRHCYTGRDVFFLKH